MANKSAENNFLIVSSMAVLLVGFTAVSSILDQPLTEKVVRTERSVANVASVSTKSVAKSKGSTSKPANFDFYCNKDAKKEVAVIGNFLQIHGKGCSKSNQGTQVQIVNQSNGYTASVFATGDSEFRTDLIQLNEGQNQILIQYENGRGKKQERQVVVNFSL